MADRQGLRHHRQPALPGLGLSARDLQDLQDLHHEGHRMAVFVVADSSAVAFLRRETGRSWEDRTIVVLAVVAGWRCAAVASASSPRLVCKRRTPKRPLAEVVRSQVGRDTASFNSRAADARFALSQRNSISARGNSSALPASSAVDLFAPRRLQGSDSDLPGALL